MVTMAKAELGRLLDQLRKRLSLALAACYFRAIVAPFWLCAPPTFNTIGTSEPVCTLPGTMSCTWNNPFPAPGAGPAKSTAEGPDGSSQSPKTPSLGLTGCAAPQLSKGWQRHNEQANVV